MNRIAMFALTLGIGSTAVFAADKTAGDLTDPLAILRKVDAAAKAVKSIKYEVSLTVGGALAERLADAAMRGNTSRVRELLKAGADVNEKAYGNSFTALMSASRSKAITISSPPGTYSSRISQGGTTSEPPQLSRT